MNRIFPMNAWLKGGLKIAVMAVLLLPAFAALPKPAHAMCASPTEAGNWVNVDPNARGITQIQLQFVCQDQVLNGQLYPPGPPWYVHVFGACYPTDCDWGTVGAQKLDAGWIYAFYDPGFAKNYVYAKTWPQYPGYLYVWAWTTFTDGSGRADYADSGWFQRQ